MSCYSGFDSFVGYTSKQWIKELGHVIAQLIWLKVDIIKGKLVYGSVYLHIDTGLSYTIIMD